MTTTVPTETRSALCLSLTILLVLEGCTTRIPGEIAPPAGYSEEQVDRDSEECQKEGRAKMSSLAPVRAWFATKLGAAATGAAAGALLGTAMVAGGGIGPSPSGKEVGIAIAGSIAFGLVVGSIVGTFYGFKQARAAAAEEQEAGRDVYADCLRARGYAVAPAH